MNERLKELRKALGLTQGEFAARISLKQSTISGWESGAAVPADSTLALICQTFGVSEAWLREGTGPMLTAQTPDERMADWLGDAVTGEISEEEYILLETLRRIPPEAKSDFLRALREAMEEAKMKYGSAD